MDVSSTYVVIYNYSPTAGDTPPAGVNLLPLWVGERVRVVSHNQAWCYGHRLADVTVSGLFPRANVHQLPASDAKSQPESQRLADEIADAVKLWWRHLKRRFRRNIDTDANNEHHLRAIEDLMVIRNQLQAANIPGGELKKIRQIVARKIDSGNVALGLRMQIRDDTGKAIPINELSVAAAYRHHEEAHRSLSAKLTAECDTIERLCSILLSVDPVPELKAFAEDVEFAINLTNEQTGEPETETLTLHWSAAERRFRHDCCRALLVDLTTCQFRGGHLRLNVALSKLCLSTPPPVTVSNNSPSKRPVVTPTLRPVDVRQLHAFGSTPLTDKNCDLQGKDKREILLNVVKISRNSLTATSVGPCSGAPVPAKSSFPLFGGRSNVEAALAACAAAGTTTSFDYKIPLSMSVQLLPGSLDAIQTHNAGLFLSANPPPPALLQRIRPADAKQVLDFRRNEVYVQLRYAELRAAVKASGAGPVASSSAGSDFDVVFSVWDSAGKQLPNCFEIITPQATQHRSALTLRVRGRDERQQYHESVKILLPDRLTRCLHLRLLFYNQRQTHKGSGDHKHHHNNGKSADLACTPVALAYTHLIENFVLAADSGGDTELCVYKIETSKFDERNVSYLKLNSRRAASSISSGSVASTMPAITAYGSFALVEKAVVAVRHTSVSAFYTKSARLLDLLDWRDADVSDGLINQRIHKLLDVVDSSWSRNDDEMHELLKFLSALLDALFDISADKRLSKPAQITVFDAIVQIIRLCHEPKNKQFMQVLEDYIRKFSSTTAHSFLADNIIRCLEDDENINVTSQAREPRDRVLSVLKALESLTKLTVVSKRAEFLVGECSNSEKAERPNAQRFIEQMNQILEMIEKLTRFTTATRITVQNAAVKYFPSIIAPLLQYGVYEPIVLAKYVANLVNNFADTVIPHQKLTLISEVIDTELFSYRECRHLLMPNFVGQLLSFISPNVLATKESRQKHSINATSTTTASSPPTIDAEALNLVELAARILTDLLEKLFPLSHAKSAKFEYGMSEELYSLIVRSFRPVNQTLIVLLNESTQSQTLHMLLLTILDKLSAENFQRYFKQLPTIINRLDVCSEMLHMFRDILHQCYLPTVWYQMHRIQHRLLAKMVQYAGTLIIQQFRSYTYQKRKSDERRTLSAADNGVQLRAPPPSSRIGSDEDGLLLLEPAAPMTPCELTLIPEMWLECILTLAAIAKSLVKAQSQLENGSLDDASADADSNRSLSSQVANTLRSLWFSLQSAQKLKLMPYIMGPILEIALHEEEPSFREIIIPIFYDMLETENYHVIMTLNRNARPLVEPNSHLSNCSATIVSSQAAAPADDDCSDTCRMFTDEFIAQLDPLLDENYGGPLFRQAFIEIFSERSLTRPTLNLPTVNSGIGELDVRQFISKVDKLLELLLNYRQVRLNSDCIENGMYCTVQLIDFYQQIEQNSLYVNYLYKLYDLHVLSGNFVEAALTLKKHANLLKWTDDVLEDYLVARAQHKLFNTHAKLKKHIYAEMVDLFDRGEHWEKAVDVLKELISVYENQLYDFDELAQLLKLLAELYTKIASTIRMEHNYFIVAFHGRDTPPYLRCKRLIFRGEKLEQWNIFKERMLHNYHGFKFVDTMDLDVDLADASGKFIQIIPVTAQPSATYTLLSKSPTRLARWYYKHNDVQRFELLRREMRPNTRWTSIEDNDATRLWIQRIYMTTKKPLPDILKFSEIAGNIESELADPMQVAVMKVEEVNEQLVETAQLVAGGFVQFLVNLGGKIRGVLQADVGGGIRNYEAFFTDSCWNSSSDAEKRTIHSLKSLLREHITILEYALYVHASKRANINETFHNALVESFTMYRKNVESRFGTARSVLPPGATICLSEQNLQRQESALSTVKDDVEWNTSFDKQSFHAAVNSQSSMSAKSKTGDRTSNSRLNSAGSSTFKSLTSPITGNSLMQPSGSGSSILHWDSKDSIIGHLTPRTSLNGNPVASFRQQKPSVATGNANSSMFSAYSPNALKRHGLRSLGRMISAGGGSPSTKGTLTVGDIDQQPDKDETRTMIMALQQLSTKRISSNSLLNFTPDEIPTARNSTISENSLLISDEIHEGLQPLPPRTSAFHSYELISGN